MCYWGFFAHFHIKKKGKSNMKTQYCIKKNCTHRLCPHHYSKGKQLLEKRVVKSIILRDFEMVMGCKSHSTYKFFKDEFTKKKRL